MDAGQIQNIELAGSVVYGEVGQPVPLAQLWQAQPVILIFLRHFSSIACRAHAREVWSARHEYERSGAKIVFIGCGTPENIVRFKMEMGLIRAEVYTDPGLKVFAQAGFKRGFLSAMGPRSALNFARLSWQGFRHHEYRQSCGDRLQLGGVLLVMPGGIVRYKFTSTALGHFPPASDLDYIRDLVHQPFELASLGAAEDIPDFSRR